MNKVALIIPIHEAYFKYLKILLKSYINGKNNKYCDLIIVFDNKDISKNFQEFEKDKCIIFLYLNEYYDNEIFTKEKGIITVKKLYGVNYCVGNKYEYMITIDSEIYILDLSKIYKISKNIHLNKKIYSGSIIPQKEKSKISKRYVNNECYKFIDKYTINKTLLKKIDINYYTFWSDLPVYEYTSAKNFLKYIEFDNKKKLYNNLNWYCFDIILYNYYCIMFYDYNIVSIDIGKHSIVKNLDAEMLQKFISLGLYSHITTPFHYNPKNKCFKDICIIHHIDKYFDSFKHLNLIKV